jgi:hypothetical protein
VSKSVEMKDSMSDVEPSSESDNDISVPLVIGESEATDQVPAVIAETNS